MQIVLVVSPESRSIEYESGRVGLDLAGGVGMPDVAVHHNWFEGATIGLEWAEQARDNLLEQQDSDGLDLSRRAVQGLFFLKQRVDFVAEKLFPRVAPSIALLDGSIAIVNVETELTRMVASTALVHGGEP